MGRICTAASYTATSYTVRGKSYTLNRIRFAVYDSGRIGGTSTVRFFVYDGTKNARVVKLYTVSPYTMKPYTGSYYTTISLCTIVKKMP